jgi:hypothetical protein
MNPWEDFIVGALWLLGGTIVYLTGKELLEAFLRLI